jgi:FKBP-type peptidyl-prolyl cis-trans isomerase FklB
MKRIAFPALALIVAISAAWALAQQARPTPQPIGVGNAVPGSAKAAPARADQPAAASGLTTDKQKTSYCVGLITGSDMVNRRLTPDDLDMAALARGIADALAKAKPALSNEEIQTITTNLHQEMMTRMREFVKTLSDKNKKEGETFLAANKGKADVKSTPSGLQYRIVKSGAGATPALGDKATAHYRGTLLDGTEFDSSYKRNEPAEFTVGGLIPGFNEALQMMKVGDKWQVFIPAELGYGEAGAPPDIAPNSTLVFDIELLDVKKGGGAKGGFSQ